MSRLMCAFIDISRLPCPLTERSRPASSASCQAGGTFARSPRAQASNALKYIRANTLSSWLRYLGSA